MKARYVEIIEKCTIWFAIGYCLGMITMEILSTIEVPRW